MKRFAVSLLIAVVGSALLAGEAVGQTVWDGPLDVTFTKIGIDDFTLPENQDFITDNVIITRAQIRGLFNIAQEAAYDGRGTVGFSPAGTEWSFGTTENWESLNFTPWAIVFDREPDDFVNRDLVVHLIEDDIYLDIYFTAWGESGQGTVTYTRSSAPAVVASIDTDGDGVFDEDDNCIEVSQSTPNGWCDDDQDGYGNACDGDFDNNFTVGQLDFGVNFLLDFILGASSNVEGNPQGTDMNCDGVVDGIDFSPPYFLSQYMIGTPGPSGTANFN